MPTDAAAPRAAGLEDDLAAILGIGTQDPKSSFVPRRRFGALKLAAALLVTTSSAAILYLAVKPHAQDRSGDRVAAVEPLAPSVAAPYGNRMPEPDTVGKTDVAAAMPSSPVPEASSVQLPVQPARVAAAASVPAAKTRPALTRSTEDARTRTATKARQSANVEVATTERSVVRVAPPASPREEVERAPSATAGREQFAASEAPSASATATVTASDAGSDEPPRRKDKRRDERKVLESLDAMRMLRRQ